MKVFVFDLLAYGENLEHVKVGQELPYPLSRDQAKLDQLKQDLAAYRLAFGQPRQEDLLALLHRPDSETGTAPRTLDLRPVPEDSSG